MSMLNFGGFSSPNPSIGFDGQNATSITAHNYRAVLFVFKPYAGQFHDVGMRSFQYQFDDNFIASTQEYTDLAKRGAVGSGGILQQFMGEKNFSDYMTASAQPRMAFMASQLSDKYRFILVLTEKAAGLMGGNTFAGNLGSNQVRRIYNGYFVDEPFNPATLTDTKRTLNPNAFMVITHKTVVGSSTESGPYGAKTSINTRASEEVINSQISASYMSHYGSDNGIFLMTPSNCISDIDVGSDGFAMAVPGAHSDITRDRGFHVVADTLEQPTHNVGQIVKGMLRHQDDVSTRNRLMTSRVEALYENDFMEESASRANLGRYMDIPRSKNISQFDLDLNTPMSADTIDQMVGRELHVVDFDLPRPQFYDTADQMQQDMINQYSYLIAMVVPPILNAAGLNAMQFIYEVKYSQGQVVENFTKISAEPHWNMSQQETFNTALAVEMELKRGIFGTIFNSKGAFRVQVSANTTGNTVVRLDLIDQGCRSYADFEIPSSLGGLISPLIGDSLTNAGNGEMITGLYAASAGMTSGLAGFNQDDRDFMEFANGSFEERSLLGTGGYPGELSD